MPNYLSTISLKETLAQNPEYNAPLLNVIERGCDEDSIAVGNSVCIRDKISSVYMLSVNMSNELSILLDRINEENEKEKKERVLMVNNSLFKNVIIEKFSNASIKEYNLYVMEEKDYIPCTEVIEDFEITLLDLSWLDYILSQYCDKEFGNKCYISDRIHNGPGLGLLYKGDKAAFVLQHKNGESGPLVVNKKYRAKGLGSYLLKHFNKILFEKNTILYGLVEPDNKASAHMMVNSGYRLAENNVLWVHCNEIL